MRRRQFLKAGAAGLACGAATQSTAVSDFLRIIYQNLERRVYASANTETLNYVNCVFPGAPPRWIFDHMLKTSTQDPDVTSNPMVVTRYNSGGTAGDYSLYDYNGVLVPSIWSTNVTTGGGGQAKLEELLRHMIVIRGYGSGVDSHTSNCAMQTAPVPSLGSVHGYVADHSHTPLKVVQYPIADFGALGAFSGYRSITGTGASGVIGGPAGTNLVERLLFPFGNHYPTSVSLKRQYRSMASTVHKLFAEDLKARVADSEAILNDFEASQKVIQDGVDELIAAWTPLYNRYLSVIETSARALGVPGFTDVPIIAPTVSANTINGGLENSYALFTDQLYYPVAGTDLRTWINALQLHKFAQNFALAEFCLQYGYADSLELSFLGVIPNVQGQFIKQATSSASDYTLNATFDQHATGSMAAIMLNSALYRGYGAGLLEFVSQLKQKDLFKKTVIHTASDFGRTPRVSGGGCDHGFDAMITTLITGLHEGAPMILGNVAKDAMGLGSFGQKTTTSLQTAAGTESVTLSPIHVGSTLAVLLNLPDNPWKNLASPLVEVRDGKVYALASGRMIA
ncbi:MAG: DUF1501 domain-containing protein [Bdellovibrionales bacterium]